jgi:hypothetical protein
MKGTQDYDDIVVRGNTTTHDDNYDRNEEPETVYNDPTPTAQSAVPSAARIADFEKFDDPSKAHDAPARRPRTIILGVFMALVTLFHFISLLTPVYKYISGSGDGRVEITVKYYTIEVCPMETFNGISRISRCEYTSLKDHLCTAVYERIEAAGYFGVFSLIASFFIAILCIIEYHGKVIVRSFTFRGACVVWVATMIQWILLTNVYLARHCKQTNLYEIGFKYHAAWVLPLIICLILLIPILVLYFLRKKLQGSSR